VDIPIFWLIALLKRLNAQISASLIYKGILSLETETMLSTLGIMLLGRYIYPGLCFSFRNNVFCAMLVETNTGKKCVFKKNNVMTPNIDVDMDKAIRFAISEAIKHVADV
jgi:hypothetical protein